MFSSVQILLKDSNITLHMIPYTYFILYDMKIAMRVFRTFTWIGVKAAITGSGNSGVGPFPPTKCLLQM